MSDTWVFVDDLQDTPSYLVKILNDSSRINSGKKTAAIQAACR